MNLVNGRVRTTVLVPLLLGLIGAEAFLGLCGLALGRHPDRPAVAASTQLVAAVHRASAPTTAAPVAHPTGPARAGVPATKPTTTTTVAPAPAPAPAPRTDSVRLDAVRYAPPVQPGWGCAAALTWLATHSAPGYQFVCPGVADGHQAMTCINTSACPGTKLIVIADPCPAAYMNEAHNSWVISGLASGPIDPFGHCD